MIHITRKFHEHGTRTRKFKFTNAICRASISEEEAQENFDNESSDPWLAPANEGRHENCRTEGLSDKPESLYLGALRSCRQMYNEAHHIPYSTSTFSCADAETLNSFVIWLAKGLDDNHLAVRSLFVEMVIKNDTDHYGWIKSLATCARYLKNLQTVNISFEWKSWCLIHLSWAPAVTGNRKTGVVRRYMSELCVLQKLPLKYATFVISDSGDRSDYYGREQWQSSQTAQARWTLAEKQDCAREVKEVILKMRQQD